MTFTNLEFLFMFAPALFAAYLVSKTPGWRNAVLFIASILFYAWGEPVFVLFMLLSVLFNWGMALVVDRARGASRTTMFVAALVFNVLALFSFKYVDFVVSAFTDAGLLTGIDPLNLPVPLGISFYSFQALAYIIDLYKGAYPAQRNPIKLTLVIAAFPTVTAGPILRYKDMQHQLGERDVSLSDAAAGLRRVLIGVAKKVLIANNVAYVASQVFAYAPEQYGFIGAWVGAIAWTLQIYFDFSGYTDIAVGLGMMLGFRYPENFNYPYAARSVSDFWRRWHISLSSFFRDYVYIPLGGNRVSTPRWLFNMFVVWALTGLWHGANWTFIVWGLCYGVLIAFERLVIGDALERAPGILRHGYVLLVTVAGWVLFMSPSITDAGAVYAGMLGVHGWGSITMLERMRVVQPLYLLAMIAGIVGSFPWTKTIPARLASHRFVGIAVDLGLMLALLVSLTFIITSTFSPFLYVRF